MAGWISSKLKVAETFLQQIDQQAAESLGKNERPRSSTDALRDDAPKRPDPAPRLKYQLPKKSSTPPQSLPSPPIGSPRNPDPSPRSRPPRNSASDPSVAAADDWTELLASTKPPSPVPRSNGLAAAPAKAAKKPAPKYALPGNSSTRTPAPIRKLASAESLKQEPASPDVESVTTSRTSLSGGGDSPDLAAQLPGERDIAGALLEEGKGPGPGPGPGSSLLIENVMEKRAVEPERAAGGVKKGLHKDEMSASSSGSDSGSDSGSSSDSEDERRRREERRKRRERLMEERAAEAIKERENAVARLEGEKQSLEKILEERERQRAQEASDLQTSMIETMDAVELEKQKHSSTRMEALARLTKLEVTNTELARALATTQWNLEVEVNRVTELRQQIKSKEFAQEDYRRRMSGICQATPSLSEVESLKRDALEQEILDAEYSLVCDKIAKLKDKAKKLEDNIVITRNEIMHPSEVEVELRRRLAQLTDHLIQKQTQVEALSSEKSTLTFRIEAISKSLDENGLTNYAGVGSTSSLESVDVEAGVWKPSNLAPRRALRDRIRSGQQQLGSVVKQLDAIFSFGLVFMRRNPMAQLWAFFYILCLHLWVVYILMSRTKVSDDTSHGAVFSLENINKTLGS